jgi:uncharacterized membrane protein
MNTRGLMVVALFHPRRHGLGLYAGVHGRAAFLHLGAFTATIMSANVFFIIMPNQRVVVADLIAGRVPTRNTASSPSSARRTTTT